ncbi:MAG: 16S rRNA processing protein RimM [Candidatus Zixiibacteriota bacterium]|nr:MAG: 16S rRNA processing protein RimM [candidate division Zixibacteria bacterium]
MVQRPEYVVVGRFGRTRGVSGEIYVQPLSDNPERFQGQGTFWIESGGGWEEVRIISSRYVSGKPAVQIEGVSNPEEAKRFTNKLVFIKGTDLGELPKGKYYHFDLLGCRVVGKDSGELGRVIAVEEYPANDVLVIEDKNGKRHLLPMVAAFIRDVDIKRQVIKAVPPEGIFDSPDEN